MNRTYIQFSVMFTTFDNAYKGFLLEKKKRCDSWHF